MGAASAAHSRLALIAAAVGAAVAALVLAGADATAVVTFAAVGLGGVALVWIGCCVEPALLFSLGLLLSPFSGNWQQLGLPGTAAPDRLVLIGAIVAVVVRTPGARDRPRLRLEPVHLALALAAAWALASALAAGTLLQRESFFRLLESYGLIPFAVFALAPVVFRTERERNTLLCALVVLGAYLGLTALFETVGARALVFPRYISDPNYGIQNSSFGRARGPFTESATDGLALYACAVAAAIAVASWKGRGARITAAAVGVLCAVGTLFSLQRAVWIAAFVATFVTLLWLPRLRRFLVPAAVAGVVTVGAAVVFIPGLAAKVHQRSHDQSSIYDRQNLNAAALAATEAHPLTGIGWGRFLTRNVDYLQQAGGRPLVQAATVSQVLKVSITKEPVHNVYLGYAAELGLVGAALWAVAFAAGVGGALLARPPPPLAYWRMGLAAVAIAVLIVDATVPPANFPILLLWLWAGVVWVGRGREEGSLEAG